MKATRQRREDLLIRRDRQAETDRVPFVATYFPGAEKLRRGLKKFQHLLDDDQRLTKALPSPPILAFRQPPSLRRLLVRSKFHSLELATRNSVQPCGKARCCTCAAICTETTIVRNQVTYDIKGIHSCYSRDVVYLIRCRRNCPDAWYIGETEQTMRQRMNTHRSTIRNQSPLPVATHFNLPRHSAADMLVSILKGGLHDIRQRKVTEQKLIKLLDTYSTGLNRDLGFMVHYK